MKKFTLICLSFLTIFSSYAGSDKYLYLYKDRTHSISESAALIGTVYGISWGLYPLTQWDTFKNDGSIDKYKKNFGRIVFDQDEPIWNWVVHPFSGSQLFLFYRANGYSRVSALTMSFISSTLFEFTIEIYTEPASVQDIYQTPVLGALVGIGIETVSMYLLNLDNIFATIAGHIINPSTMFGFYEGRFIIAPKLENSGITGIIISADF